MTTFNKYHLPCPMCDSSDAYAIDHDGIGHCFSCGGNYNENTKSRTKNLQTTSKKETPMRAIELGIYCDIDDRGITKDTAIKYKYQVSTDGKKHIANVADLSQKIRFLEDKKFLYINKPKTEKLYGDFAFEPNKEQPIVITEGELDAMSVHQISNLPAVSITHGTQSAKKCIEHNLDYLKGFKKVIIAFDNDDAGKKSTAFAVNMLRNQGIDCSELKYPEEIKDANEALIKGFEIDLMSALDDAANEVEAPVKKEQKHDYYYILATDKFYFVRGNEAPRPLNARNMLEYLTTLKGIDKQIASFLIAKSRDPFGEQYCLNSVEFPYQRPGRILLQGEPYMNIANLKVTEPTPGTPDRLLQFFHEIWGEEQTLYMLSWMKHLYEGCRDYNMSPGQAVYLAGDQGAGKNLFHDKILASLIGQGSDATQLITSSFNGLVYKSAYATIADKFTTLSEKDRTRLFGIIKDTVANGEVTVNPKYGTQYQMKWCGRIILSLNLGVNSSDALPLADKEDMQKYSLIRCSLGEMIQNTSREEWDKIVNDEKGKLANYLQNFKIPEELKDQRFGTRAFHNQELLDEIALIAPDRFQIEAIYDYMDSGGLDKMIGKSAVIFDTIKIHDDLKPEHLRLFPSNITVRGFERNLVKLAKQYDWISKVKVEEGVEYIITKPKITYE